METIDFKKQLNGMPIIPFYGNDIVHIGMSLEELDNILRTHYGLYGEQSNTGYCLTYWIQLEKSIRITLDIVKRQVYRVDFLREYKGKALDGYGVGSTVKEIYDSRNDVYFDEEYILVGKYPYDFIIEIDNQDTTIYSLEQVFENKITQITVKNKEILR